MKVDELKVGDKVKGTYFNGIDDKLISFTGKVVRIGEIDVQIDMVDMAKRHFGSWDCKIRPDKEVASSFGYDNGEHNLEWEDGGYIQKNEQSEEDNKTNIMDIPF